MDSNRFGRRICYVSIWNVVKALFKGSITPRKEIAMKRNPVHVLWIKNTGLSYVVEAILSSGRKVAKTFPYYNSYAEFIVELDRSFQGAKIIMGLSHGDVEAKLESEHTNAEGWRGPKRVERALEKISFEVRKEEVCWNLSRQD